MSLFSFDRVAAAWFACPEIKLTVAREFSENISNKQSQAKQFTGMVRTML